MALTQLWEKKVNKVTFKSGQFYQFKYRAFLHDPHPMIIFVNAIQGIHSSGNQHRYLQGINLNYIPKRDRTKFVKDFMRLNAKNDIKFTWKLIQRRYPYIAFAVRRYFYMPTTYITELTHIPEELVENAVKGTWHKDFSKQIQRSLAAKMKQGKKVKKKPNPKRAAIEKERERKKAAKKNARKKAIKKSQK